MDKQSVLIVDDIPSNLQLVGSSLRQLDLKIFSATNGEQALDIVNRLTPDLILLDVEMPGMDGYEVCRLIKSEQRNRNIPVIFLTVRDKEEDIMRGFDSGAVDYITKPFRLSELNKRVLTHLELKRSHDIINLQKSQLEKQNAQLRDLNNAKDLFFTIIAHDLEGPFSALIGSSTLLLEEHKEVAKNNMEDLVKLIFDASNFGLDLLKNLVIWAQSQTGRIEAKPKQIKLKPFVKKVISSMKCISEQKKIRLYADILDDMVVTADEYMLNTVLRNLISNGIKYTNAGGKVTVNTLLFNDIIGLRVKDTGIGIKKDKIKTLFEIDESYVTDGTEDERGTGLGLIICKDFVKKMGGDIWAESKPNEGSNFIFTLPRVVK